MIKSTSFIVILTCCWYSLQVCGGVQNVPDIQTFTSTTFLRDKALQDGKTLMSLCKIPEGDAFVASPSWHVPNVVLIGSLQCQVKRWREGFLIVPLSGINTNAIAFVTVLVAKDERENRRDLFSGLAFCSLPLSDVARNLSVERSSKGWYCLRRYCLAEWRGHVEKMAKCHVMFKNVTISVEAQTEEKEIALALLDAGFQEKRQADKGGT